MSDEDDKTRILQGPIHDEALTRVLKAGELARGARPSDDDASTRVLKAGDLARAAQQSDEDTLTRVLKRDDMEAPTGQPGHVVAPPGAPGDRIVFSCPNGHRIAVEKKFAGRRGKCNKCGAAVQIPKLTVDPFAALINTFEESEAPDADTASKDESESPPLLEGLPFGDEAHAPSSTAGDGPEAAEEHHEEEAVDWNFAAAASSGNQEDAAPWSGDTDAGMPLGADSGNPTAQLVARLWAEREHGGIIEMHLVGGAVLLPEWYDANWSRGTHGLFASQAADGSVTITAVAWENVEKVIVRQLSAVPDDMFA